MSGTVERAETEARTPPRPGTFTARALVIGTLLTAFVGWLSPVALYSLFSSRIHYCILPPGVVMMAVALVLANLAVSRARPRLALNPGELAVIVSMMWLGTAALFQLGAADSMISVMASPEYFASPENRWAEYWLVHIPKWMIPSDRMGAVRAFFNGLPPGSPIPWRAWVTPLFWWGSLIAALVGVVVASMAIVHEQWNDHEKLSFPMADIPLALIGNHPDGSMRTWLPGWVRNPLFWYGAAIPAVIILWNTLNWFYPEFPAFAFSQVGSNILFFKLGDFSTKVDWFTIGLAYFTPSTILRGFWIGRVIIGAEMAAGMHFGFAEGTNKGFEPWSDWGTNTAAWQCSGALIAFTLWGFWTGREHFGKVLRSAVRNAVDLPPRLRNRYRLAVWGGFACMVYLGFWFRAAGMAWLVVAAFIPLVVLLNLGLSKLIVQSTFLYMEGPVSAQTLILQTAGSAAFSATTMTAFALSYVIFRANAGTMMPQVAFAGRVGDQRGVPRGKLYGALGIGLAVFLVTAVGTVIILAYDVGAFNFPSLAYRSTFFGVYDSLILKRDAALGPDWTRLGFFSGGAVSMLAIMAMRTRFPGFWLHPIGFTFATTSVAGLMTMNIFLAWLAKWTLDTIGGYPLTQRARPFFLGLVAGHSVALGITIAIDAIFFPGAGHYVMTGW